MKKISILLLLCKLILVVFGAIILVVWFMLLVKAFAQGNISFMKFLGNSLFIAVMGYLLYLAVE